MTDNIFDETDQTRASDAGHTTSEHFFTKVLMICGIVIAAGSFLTETIVTITGVLPAGSPMLRYAAIGGTVVATVSKIAYIVSRTLVKMKLADAEIEAVKAGKLPDPSSAAATMLGQDAPQK
jgi:hypothetical protein